MEIIDCNLNGLKIIKPKIFGDSRGFFFESFEFDRYRDLVGIEDNFVQDNISMSSAGVLRGLHFQLNNTQGKLVTVIKGTVFDVAVDIRKKSETFGKWFGVVLSDENHWQLWIPKGFAHGFYVMSENAYFHYKCTNFYDPASEVSIIWNDPNIGIKWPITVQPTLSAKDLSGKLLCELPTSRLL